MPHSEMLLDPPAAFSHLLLQLSHPPLQHGQLPLRLGTRFSHTSIGFDALLVARFSHTSIGFDALLVARFSHTSIGFDALLVARFSNSPLCFLVKVLLLITDLGGKLCRLV